MGDFLNRTKNFSFIRFSALILKWPKEEDTSTKAPEIKIHWLQKTKITLKYSKDIMLDNNTIYLSHLST